MKYKIFTVIALLGSTVAELFGGKRKIIQRIALPENSVHNNH